MSDQITNSIGLRTEMENKGIGLNSSGSYVLRSFDADELKRVQATDFSKLNFSEEEFVDVANGSQGSLAKPARVTNDHKFARYLGNKYISVALIQGQVFPKSKFVRSIAKNPTLHVIRCAAVKDFVGILHGDRNATYKSLVYLAGNPTVPANTLGFLFLDLEEKPPAQSLNMKVRIVAENPPEGAAVKAELLKQFV